MTVQDLHRAADPEPPARQRSPAPRRAFRRRRRFKRLQDLDDHMLDDIGVTRDEVEIASRLPLGFDAFAEARRMTRERRLRDPWGMGR